MSQGKFYNFMLFLEFIIVAKYAVKMRQKKRSGKDTLKVDEQGVIWEAITHASELILQFASALLNWEIRVQDLLRSL